MEDLKLNQMKELKTVRYTFRMTEKEAQELEKAAKILDCKPAQIARLAVSAVTEAAKEKGLAAA